MADEKMSLDPEANQL